MLNFLRFSGEIPAILPPWRRRSVVFFGGGGEEWLFSPDNIPEGTFAVVMMP